MYSKARLIQESESQQEVYIPYPEDVFRSKTLSIFMGKLDASLVEMEETIDAQKEEIKSLNKQIAEESTRQMRQGQAMIGNVLKACVSVPDMTEIEPAAAIVIDRIDHMNTIEEVKEYIASLKSEGRKQLDKKK